MAVAQQRLSWRGGVLSGLLGLVLFGSQAQASVQLEVQALSVHGRTALHVEEHIRSEDLLQPVFQPASARLSAGYRRGASGGFHASASATPLTARTMDVVDRVLPVVWQFRIPPDQRDAHIRVEASWLPSDNSSSGSGSASHGLLQLRTERPRLVASTERGDLFEITARMQIPVALFHHPESLAGRVRLEVFLQ